MEKSENLVSLMICVCPSRLPLLFEGGETLLRVRVPQVLHHHLPAGVEGVGEA